MNTKSKLRNNLLVKDLTHAVAVIDFENQKERVKYDNEDTTERIAFDFGRKSTQILLPKIHDEHIKPTKLKMKVNIATQVFSRSYGRAMQVCSDNKQLSRDFTGTANILHFFNDVFDSLNEGGPPIKNSLNGSINETSDHFVFWEYAIEMIKKMKFADLNGRKDSSKVLSDYIVTIKGLSELTRTMLIIQDTIALRRTTQDALENYFGGIRSSIYSPSVREFRGAYGSMMVNNLCLQHSIYSNCEEDGGRPLLRNFNLLLSSTQPQTSKQAEGITIEKCEEESGEPSNVEIENLPFITNEGLDYVSVDVCKKLLKCVKCANCRA